MKGQLWNPGAPVRREDRDHEQNSTQESMRERVTDLFTSGVFKDSQFAGENIPFEITPGSTDLEVNVGSGVALSDHDVTDRPESIDGSDLTKNGGERILIPEADTLAGNDHRNDPGAGVGTGTGTGTFKESANGLGGWTSTPESTLTRDVPLTNATVNYIWLGYLRTTATGVGNTVIHKYTASILYPFAEDGYKILVTTSAVPPSPDMLLLGTADTTGAGAPVIDQSAMPFARLRGKHANVSVSADLKPSAYTIPGTGSESDIPVEDHVNAIGTGTVTPVNPHGNAIADFGIAFEDVDLVSHRDKHHSNGLIGSNVTTTSSLYPRTDNATPVGGDLAMVFLKQLTSGEEVIVAGKRYAEVLPKLTALTGSGAVGDAYVSFGGGDAAGVYDIILTDSGGDLTASKRTPTSAASNSEYIVCQVEWNGAAFINPAAPGIQADVRLYGTIAQVDIQEEAVGTSELQTSAVTEPKLADLSVSSGKLQASSVTTTKIADSNVTTAKINDLAVTTAKVNDGAITEPKLGDDAVTSPKLDEWDGGSLASQPSSGSGVATAHLKDGAVTTAKIADGAVTIDKLGTNAKGLQWTKITKTFSDFSVGLQSQDFVLTSLPVKGVVHGISVHHTERFLGGPITTYEIQIGNATSSNKYMQNFDIAQPESPSTFNVSDTMNMEDFGSATSIIVTATVNAGATLSNATQGSVDIYILTSQLP